MSIIATNDQKPRELIPAGNYIARCYSMIHIGAVPDTYMGVPKIINKVRLGWELPTEKKVFDSARGAQPLVISKTYTLSMAEKANLRKALASWRGKDFTEEQAKSFDVTKLIGVACMLNIIHKPSKDGTKTYEEISNVSPIPKGMVCPAQINPNQVWEYDKPNYDVFNLLPDFLKTEIQTSEQYKKLHAPENVSMDHVNANDLTEPLDDLPF